MFPLLLEAPLILNPLYRSQPIMEQFYIDSLIVWLLNIICVHKSLNYQKFYVCDLISCIYHRSSGFTFLNDLQEKIPGKIWRDKRTVAQTEFLEIFGKLFP